MTYLKKVLVNKYEEETDAALKEAAARSNAVVFSKVSIKDILDIDSLLTTLGVYRLLACNIEHDVSPARGLFVQSKRALCPKSGQEAIDKGKTLLTKEEYSYAFKAHFDFVITRADTSPVFAVEYDGSMHYDDPATIERDKKKNEICQKLGMPLFRIDSQYLKRIGNFSLIEWLTELWFIYEGWAEAQEKGLVPYDEPFLYFLVLGYDPFAPSRIFIQRLYEEKRILDPAPRVATAIDDQGYARAIAWVQVRDDVTVLGHARCLFFMTHPIPSVGAHSLSEELAVVDAAEKLKRYFRGTYQPLKNEELHQWHDRFYKWGSIELR